MNYNRITALNRVKLLLIYSLLPALPFNINIILSTSFLQLQFTLEN